MRRKSRKFRKDFISVLDDDFNTPKAIAVLFNVVVKGNTARTKEVLSEKNAKEILFFLKEIDKIFYLPQMLY